MRIPRALALAAILASIAVASQGCKKKSPEPIPWPEEAETRPPATPEPAHETAPPEAGAQDASASAGDATDATASPETSDTGAAPADDDTAGAEAAKGPKGEPKIVLVPADPKVKPVTFKHKYHQDMFGCRKCHHTMEPKAVPEKCGSCHGSKPDVPDVKTAFHGKCKSCHNAMGAGPTKCTECHK